MKIITPLVLCLLLLHQSITLQAQKIKVNWGEEFRLKKGSTDLSVFASDKSGIYLSEEHFAIKSYFVIGATSRNSATLVKLDKNLVELYRNDFNKELKGKDFEDFFMLGDKIFIFANDYNKKTKVFTMLAAEINKADGTLKTEFKEVTNWVKETKSERFTYKKTYNQDSTSMILVSSNDKAENDYYQVKEFDGNLNQIGYTNTISTEFNSKKFKLEDIFITKSKTVMLVGKNFEYADGKKQVARNLEFNNYVINLYDNNGKLIKELSTTIDGRFLLGTKVIPTKNNEAVLAAFYSNQKRGKEITGMLVQRIKTDNGEVISTSYKPLNTSLITSLPDDANDDDDDKDSKKERLEREKLEKLQEKEGGISRYMRFSNIVPTADNGLVIVAEKYKEYFYTTTDFSTAGGVTRRTTRTYAVYQSSDILMTKVTFEGNIDWLHILPKLQSETIEVGNGYNSFGLNYFDNPFNMPFYSGMLSFPIPASQNVAILFNDNPKNDNVLQFGQKVKAVTRFSKSACTMVTLNPATGVYTRKSIFSNGDQPPAMIRFGKAVGKDFYLVGREERLLGKTKIAVCKLSF